MKAVHSKEFYLEEMRDCICCSFLNTVKYNKVGYSYVGLLGGGGGWVKVHLHLCITKAHTDGWNLRDSRSGRITLSPGEGESPRCPINKEAP